MSKVNNRPLYTNPCLPHQIHEYYDNEHILRYPLLSLLDEEEEEEVTTKASKEEIKDEPKPKGIKELKEELYLVCKTGSLSKVKEMLDLLVELNVDVNNIRFMENLTMLHIAASNNHLKLIKYLIKDLKVDIEAKDELLESALLKSIKKGYYEISKYLLNHDANPHTIDYQGFNALHKACGSGNLELVKLLIEEYELDINSISNAGFTSLMSASARNYIDVLKYLLSQKYQKLNLLCKNQLNETAYSIACSCKHFEAAQLLHNAEMKINQTFDFDTTVHNHVLIMVYENQKMQTSSGLFSLFNKKVQFNSNALLATDKVKPFQLYNTNEQVDLKSFSLPKGKHHWSWLSEWEIIKEEDSNSGWLYNTEFKTNGWSNTFNIELHKVRRRCWVRVACREMMF